ncbi:MAG: Bug family tripartite tricarboxylate transporter substrate binding protein [Bradyrhizobium sp.]
MPYRGTTPALQDLMGDNVDMFFDNLGSSLNLHLGGKIRILAVGGAERVSSLPDIPTVREAGVPDFQSVTWFALMAPHQTPDAIVARLNTTITEILKEPDVRERFSKIGVQPVGADIAATARFINEERSRWGAIIKTANVITD